MQLKIHFNRVIDHCDLLTQESQKCFEVINKLDVIHKENQLIDPERASYLEKAINQTEAVMKNIRRRKEMLLDIVSVLKGAYFTTKGAVDKIELEINSLDKNHGFK